MKSKVLTHKSENIAEVLFTIGGVLKDIGEGGESFSTRRIAAIESASHIDKANPFPLETFLKVPASESPPHTNVEY